MTGVDLVNERRGEISALCQRYGVVRLQLFGSALTLQWDPVKSDLDFLVEYGPKYRELDPLDSLVGLKGALEDLFGRSVDVVNVQQVRNRRFFENAIVSAREIYVA